MYLFCILISKICFHNLPYCWTIQAFLCPAWRFCSETTAPSSPARPCFATTSLCMPRRLSQQPIPMSHGSCASISSTGVEAVLRYSNSSFMYDIEAVHRDIQSSTCPSQILCSATYPLHTQHKGCTLRRQLFACLGGCTQQHISMFTWKLRYATSALHTMCKSCVTQRQFF